MIVRILQPIWTKKAEPQVVYAAVSRQYSTPKQSWAIAGANPARYVDHLQLVLPRAKKRSHVKHHPALPWEEVPAFIREKARALLHINTLLHRYASLVVRQQR
ncbi:hypothetical protein [Burkholderia ubonensis]|uniref:hypothetical protein n=1 Tax=Burkholderia ubonensis TaxID=101571 RepID=UPI00075891B7|nr:hypothetical protein [Burkholderia ubonensis]KVS39915.1 hypothetical protein WK38_03245 [Burkholderia ubonensis]KVS48010.1 hypothetical protein WK37_08175 [Burkholderia ubonensis]KVS78744.1 hypothetical protein WK42_15905 [Burkholderia ubonensis]KVS93455.1 hypothetical protein WK44_11240 [Burkholderia ubonensis]KVS94200.1 hypothetical protein WK43_09740 [Burkholderia ubonensis]